MKEKVEKVKALTLVVDYNIYPRSGRDVLDATNLSRIKKALKSGIEMDPIIVDRKTRKIVDGVHRHNKYLDVFGEDAEIPVVFRDYKNDMDMFLASAEINNRHGLALSPRDKAYVISRAIATGKVPMGTIAQVLGMDEETTEKFVSKRTAIDGQTGETVVLSGGARNLKQQTLTKDQVDYAKTAPGVSAQHYATLLLKGLRCGAITLTPHLITVLEDLQKEIDFHVDNPPASDQRTVYKGEKVSKK